jgi:hypothetical protein
MAQPPSTANSDLQHGCTSEDHLGPWKGAIWRSWDNIGKEFRGEQQADWKSPIIVARLSVGCCAQLRGIK